MWLVSRFLWGCTLKFKYIRIFWVLECKVKRIERILFSLNIKVAATKSTKYYSKKNFSSIMDRRVPDNIYLVAHDPTRIPNLQHIIFLKIDPPFKMRVGKSMCGVMRVGFFWIPLISNPYLIYLKPLLDNG